MCVVGEDSDLICPRSRIDVALPSNVHWLLTDAWLSLNASHSGCLVGVFGCASTSQNTDDSVYAMAMGELLFA
jgi:hypothetical protein